MESAKLVEGFALEKMSQALGHVENENAPGAAVHPAWYYSKESFAGWCQTHLDEQQNTQQPQQRNVENVKLVAA